MLEQNKNILNEVEVTVSPASYTKICQQKSGRR